MQNIERYKREILRMLAENSQGLAIWNFRRELGARDDEIRRALSELERYGEIKSVYTGGTPKYILVRRAPPSARPAKPPPKSQTSRDSPRKPASPRPRITPRTPPATSPAPRDSDKRGPGSSHTPEKSHPPRRTAPPKGPPQKSSPPAPRHRKRAPEPRPPAPPPVRDLSWRLPHDWRAPDTEDPKAERLIDAVPRRLRRHLLGKRR